jgi:hypothetical protein
MSQLTFLAKVFPLSVALITFTLLIAAFVWWLRKRPSYVLHDSELEWSGSQRPVYSDRYFQGWILGLVVAIALLGFVLGIFAFISVFLYLKAGVRPLQAALAASGAIVVLSVLSHILVLGYPTGVLQRFLEMPWPFN